jgi:type II secretory pathway pseudopilin PulG
LPTGHIIAGITESHRILRKRALRGRIVLAVVAILLAATATTSLLWRAAESSKAAAMREIGLQLQETGREALLNGDTARALPFPSVLSSTESIPWPFD